MNLVCSYYICLISILFLFIHLYVGVTSGVLPVRIFYQRYCTHATSFIPLTFVELIILMMNAEEYKLRNSILYQLFPI
jgi:hypothetical protein